jgi:hypothetical protein
MIGRGKHNEVYLYEVTEQDLLVGDSTTAAYRVGNVLMFAEKRSVSLGKESARADDFSAALEYLDQIAQQSNQPEPDSRAQLSALAAQVTMRDENLRDLTEKIELRDELLRDLSETLKSQKQDNELLHAALKNTQAQLAVDELKCNEMYDDLQHASEETFTMESTLERVMEEKFALEQELAERICELVELDLQNDDLRKQLTVPVPLFEPVAESAATPVPIPVVGFADQSSSPLPGEQPEVVAPENREPQILTMASGKQIHILHEFPAPPRPSLLGRAGHALTSALRVMAIILFAAFILAAASVITTAQINHSSFGDALDLLLKSLNLI